MMDRKIFQNQEGPKVKTFSVPFTLGEKKENIIITTNTASKRSKEEIINQAFELHSQGKLSEASKYYQYFINQGFKDHTVFSNYGVLLNDLGKLQEAELSYRKAIELKPDFADAHSNLGNLLKDIGQLQEAELSFRKAIELKPDCAVAHSNFGVLLRDLGKSEEAELLYRKAIEIKPDCAEAHSNLGNLLSSLGKLKEAELSLSKAIELRQKFTTAIMNRWKLFFDQGKFDLALKDADSCNTEESRACALETLYALGRIDEIYKRIEKTSKLDDGNIRLAAFSSFISEQEKQDTSNNFCQNPLSFLYFSNIKFHCKDYVDFSRRIINDITKFKPVWEPLNKTVRNGFQTPSQINLFSSSSQNISHLKSIILNELDEYYSKFENESCSYIKKWPSNKNLLAWYVMLKKQGYQSAHIHPNGWLSGVIYLKVVPNLEKNEGAIEFSLNGENYSNKNSSQLIHQPELGDIVFFPSSLHHRVIPFYTDTDRIVLAFDLLPN